LSGKPGNVRDFTKSQGSVKEKNLVREKWPKNCLLLETAYLHSYISHIDIINAGDERYRWSKPDYL